MASGELPAMLPQLPVNFPENGTRQENIKFCLSELKNSLERSFAVQQVILSLWVQKAAARPTQLSRAVSRSGHLSLEREGLPPGSEAGPQMVDESVLVCGEEAVAQRESIMEDQGTRNFTYEKELDEHNASKKLRVQKNMRHESRGARCK